MIWIEHIGAFPQHLFDRMTEEAKRDFDAVGPEVAKQVFEGSPRKAVLWLDDEPIMICGVYEHSLLSGNAEFWALPLVGLRKRPLAAAKGLRKLADYLVKRWPRVHVRVREDVKGAKRFAEFSGFRTVLESGGVYVMKRAS